MYFICSYRRSRSLRKRTLLAGLFDYKGDRFYHRRKRSVYARQTGNGICPGRYGSKATGWPHTSVGNAATGHIHRGGQKVCGKITAHGPKRDKRQKEVLMVYSNHRYLFPYLVRSGEWRGLPEKRVKKWGEVFGYSGKITKFRVWIIDVYSYVFATPVPAKSLDDAQLREAFCIYAYGIYSLANMTTSDSSCTWVRCIPQAITRMWQDPN